MSTIKQALNDLGEEYIKELTLQLIKAGKKSSGDLINSLDYSVLETVNGYLITITSEPYLQYVDAGRRPGTFPPVKAIEKWVKREGIRFEKYTVKQTAFVIARSIKNKGIKPTNVLDKTKRNILQNIDKIISKGFSDDIEKEILKTLQSL